MNGHAESIPGLEYSYGDSFFDFDMVSSSNGMATDAMQPMHETADSTDTVIQGPLDVMALTMDSPDQLTLNWGLANHVPTPATEATLPSYTLFPGMTVAPNQVEISNAHNHDHIKEPVDFVFYDPGFDYAGGDPSSGNGAPGSYTYAQVPVGTPGQFSNFNEQLESFGGFERQLGFGPGGISAPEEPASPSPIVDQSE